MENKNILSYLEEMKGRVLKIFKGGPESKTGKLLSVNKEMMTIQTDDNQIVYYQLKHVKSIIENSKLGVGWFTKNTEDTNEVKVNNFVELLAQLKLQNVHINGGGPAYRTGKLLDFNPDYLVLQTKDDLIYYQLEHIKSISPIQYNQSDDSTEAYEVDPDYIEGTNLFALLKKMRHHWIIVNGKGAENIEGVLVDYSRDYILLVHHDEVFRISTYHINSLQLGFHPKEKSQQETAKDESSDKEGKKDESKDESKNESKNESKDESKDEKNESSGKVSTMKVAKYSANNNKSKKNQKGPK